MVTILFISFLAALVGTIAMTVSQEIEIRINKRPISYTPAQAVFKVLRLDFERLSLQAKGIASYVVHFGYGVVWGFPLALFYMAGFVEIIPVAILFFFIVWLQGVIVIPLLGIAGPFWTWGTKSVLIEIFHKIIYATVTTLTFFFLL